MADDLARRRELRRKRILENSEERKRKIFGSNNNSTIQNGQAPELKGEPVLQTDTEIQPNHNLSSGIQPNHNLSSGIQPNLNLSTNHTQNFSVEENLPDLQQLLSSVAASSDQQGAIFPSQQTENIPKTNSYLTSPIPLAILVCILLYVDLGYVISNSLAVPFILWEVHKVWFKTFVLENSTRSLGFLSIALMLCGVQQNVISTYSTIFSFISYFVEDFALYLAIVVSWYVTIGF